MRLIRALCKWGHGLGTVVLLVVVTVDFVSVILRYCFGFSFQWSAEIQQFGMIWLVFLAGGWLATRQEHLVSDLFGDRLSSGANRILAVIRILITWVTCILMMVGGIDVASNAFHIHQVSTGAGVPMGIMFGSAVVGYALSLLGYLVPLRDLITGASPDREW